MEAYQVYSIAVGGNVTGDQTAIGGEEVTGIQVGSWSGTARDFDAAYVFDFANGFQGFAGSDFVGYAAWAVLPGDVPVPPAPLLFFSGLLALPGFAKCKAA